MTATPKANGKRFLFDTSFDPAAPKAAPKVEAAPLEPELPPEPPAPSFSQEELDAANREAFAQGQAAGQAEAQASQEKQIAALLETIAASLGQLIQGQQAQGESARGEALAAALKVVETILPTLARDKGLEIVESLVRDALAHLGSEPRVVIRVGEPLAEALGERLDGLANESLYEGKLMLVPDASLDASSVRVESASGGVERDGERLWSDVRRLVQQRIDLLYRASGQEPPTEASGVEAEPEPESEFDFEASEETKAGLSGPEAPSARAIPA